MPASADPAAGVVLTPAPGAVDTALGRALPETVGLAISHALYAPAVGSSAVIVPAPAPGRRGGWLDLNAKPHRNPQGAPVILPDRFVIGDGTLNRCFVGVDKRPGSALARRIDAIVAPLRGRGRDAVIELVCSGVGELLRKTPGAATNDPGPELPWDRELPAGRAQAVFDAHARYTPVGAVTTAVPGEHPVVPLERYLELGYGYCLQKCLLGSLILERFAIPHRVVAGLAAGGHTWIELEDGRILDPTLEWLATPEPVDADWSPPATSARPLDPPRTFLVNGQRRIENQSFPYLLVG